MKICYFGTYDPTYTRNRINIQALKMNEVEVIECRTDFKSNKKYLNLIKNHWPIRKDYKIMIVGFAGHAIMPLAWFLAKLHGKKIILDLFVSQYDSVILDRKAYSPKSWPAKKYWLMDWLACKLADVLLLESNAHIEFFVKTFKIPKRKFRRVYVGCDEKIFYPREKPAKNEKFIVHFHGSYAPLQGVEHILAAAKKLANEDIHFNIIGKTNNFQSEINRSKELGLTNVTFIDLLPYEQLAEQMAQADICLGKFGDVPKIKITGAFKVVEAMAMKKTFITADTPAMREFLINRKHCLFCRAADGKDLANKILELKNNPQLMADMAENGYQLFKKNNTPLALGRGLKQIIVELA